MTALLPRAIIVLWLVVHLSACGESRLSSLSQATSFGPPEWRVRRTSDGWTAMTLRLRDPCFVRFRVTGSNDGEHS